MLLRDKMAAEKGKQTSVELEGGAESKPLTRLTELFASPKRCRNFDSCPTTPSMSSKTPRHLLKRIGKSVSESSAGCSGDPLEPSQWVKDAKNGVAAATTLEELKQHLYILLDKVNILECELKFVQAERKILQKELDSVKKQKIFPFKSLTHLLNRSSSSSSTTTEMPGDTTNKDIEAANVYLGSKRGLRRRSSSEIIVNPRVTSLHNEESVKPRRKSTTGIAKFERAKSALLSEKIALGHKRTAATDDTKGIELEEKTPSHGSVRRRSCSTSILDNS